MAIHLPNRCGAALPLALFALVVIGALVAGGVFIGTQEQRMGENQHRVMRSLAAAEEGIPELIREWDPATLNRMRVYPRDTFLISRHGVGSGLVSGSVWKLSRVLYYIVLTGEDEVSRSRGGPAVVWRGSGARQRIGFLARLRPVQVPSQGVITSQGELRIDEQAVVDGGDHTPNGTWSDCSVPDSMKGGVHINGTVRLGSEASIGGDPPVRQDTAIGDATFSAFGDVLYSDLAARATIRLSPGTGRPAQPSTVGGECNRNDINNWGDGQNHAALCGDYFPLVHVAGDLTLHGGQGQGVLLVDGNLTLAGPFEYFGVIIVSGSLSSRGATSSLQLYGSVLLKNQHGDASHIGGASQVRFSECAVARALHAISPVAIARSRGWIALH